MFRPSQRPSLRHSDRGSPSPPDTLALSACAYAVMCALALAVAAFRDAELFTTEPWWPLPAGRAWTAWPGLALSLAAGALVAAVTVGLTPVVLRRNARARALHEGLRPAVRGASDTALLVMALASGVAEELLFRGALVPWMGVLLPALGFGLLHQVRGSARWLWVAWAAAMGLVLGAVFQATGNLAGCILAHVAINAANLRLLRDHEPAPASRPLGGLLGRPSSPG